MNKGRFISIDWLLATVRLYHAPMPQRARVHQVVRAKPIERRESSSKRGYGRDWKRYADAFIASHPTCMCGPDCCPNGCHEPSECVDHIVPVSGPDDPLFWAEDNHQALTNSCHARKTARHDRHRGRARLHRPD